VPDAIIPDPDDFADRLSEAGVDRESFSLRDTGAWYEWQSEHPEWDQWTDAGLSHEAVAGMWAAGMDPDAQWEHLTIAADGDTWWVEITDADGNAHRIDIGDGYDIAWDFYDYADYAGIDIDKEIDTGEASE
jgi:hypothetical protein